MNVLKITDGGSQGSMNLRFYPQSETAISCSNLSFKLDTTGKVGNVNCNMFIGKEVKTI